MARKILMNNNKISIASLVIGLGTVVVVNYIFPVIDTALTAVCTKLNVGIVKNQAEIQAIAQESGLDDEEKLYSPGANACGFVDTNNMGDDDYEEVDDE